MYLLKLFFAFFKIGLFAFGGGYATLPLIAREIVINHAWLTPQDFSHLITVAEMTPGPIGINSATFAGYLTGGLLGAATATLGVCLPSLLIIYLLYRLLAYFAKKEEKLIKEIFKDLRPVVVALVATAVYLVGRGAFKDYGAWLIAGISFGLVCYYNEFSIIPIILTFGVVGILLY